MSQKDKRLYLFLVVLTSILLSLVMNEMYFRCRYGKYIIQSYNNSIEAVRSVENLDSTLNIIIDERDGQSGN